VSGGQRLSDPVGCCCGLRLRTLLPGTFSTEEGSPGMYFIGLSFGANRVADTAACSRESSGAAQRHPPQRPVVPVLTGFDDSTSDAVGGGSEECEAGNNGISSLEVNYLQQSQPPLRLNKAEQGEKGSGGSSGGSLQVCGNPPTCSMPVFCARLPPEAKPQGDPQVSCAADLPVRQRFVEDVRPGPDRGLIPRDRPVLLVELDGVLLGGLPLSASAAAAEAEGDESLISLPGGALLRIRPCALDFLVRMKWEAGLAVAIYTSSSAKNAAMKVEGLEKARPGFCFDFIVHGGTAGAWEGGAGKKPQLVLGPGRVADGFLIDAIAAWQDNGGEGSGHQCSDATFVRPFQPSDVASASDQVFQNLETDDIALCTWLSNVAINNSSFHEKVTKVVSDRRSQSNHGCGEEGEDDQRSVKRAVSVMSLHGIHLPGADGGDAGCGVGGLGVLRDEDARTPAANRTAEMPSSPTSNRTLSTVRAVMQPRLSRVPSNASISSRSSRTSRLSRMRTAISRRLSRRPVRPSFQGEWVCVGTWGLDDFLKANGISSIQRMAAKRAPWPSWEFQQDQDHIKFINHSFLGDITEEFEVGGPEYTAIDGKKQTLQCNASWEGETLVIERSGPQGRFKEERSLDEEGKLNFTLTSLDKASGASWGRTFARK